MSSQTLTDAELIAQLGGISATAKELGLDPGNVKKWPKRGIPWKDRVKVQALAIEKGVELPGDFLETQRRKDVDAADQAHPEAA